MDRVHDGGLEGRLKEEMGVQTEDVLEGIRDV